MRWNLGATGQSATLRWSYTVTGKYAMRADFYCLGFAILALRLLYNPVPSVLKITLPDLSLRIPSMQQSHFIASLR